MGEDNTPREIQFLTHPSRENRRPRRQQRQEKTRKANNTEHHKPRCGEAKQAFQRQGTTQATKYGESREQQQSSGVVPPP